MIQQRIGLTAIGVGLAQLIPLPLLDGMVSAHLMRRLYGHIAARHGKTLSADQRKLLTASEPGLLRGCVVGTLWWGVRKLVRTMTLVLLVKEVVDEAARATVHAFLVDEALRDGHLPGSESDVRAAIDRAIASEGTSPITRLLLRRENPLPELEQEPGLLAAFTRFLHRAGGGGILTGRFRVHLDELRELES